MESTTEMVLYGSHRKKRYTSKNIKEIQRESNRRPAKFKEHGNASNKHQEGRARAHKLTLGLIT